MEIFFDILKGFDLHTILSIIVAVWFFTRKTNKKLDELETRISNIEKRLTNLEIKFTALEARFQERGQWEARNNKTQL